MIAGYWILAEFFFFRISSLYQEASMIGLFQEPREKATVFVAQHSTRVLYVFFVLTLFCNFLRLHRWHCPRITNFVSLRGIKAGNPERARGTHLCRLGNQSEHFAYKNIISFFLRSFYWQNSSLSCSFYSPRISHLPGISYADVSENWLPFERLSTNNYGELTYSVAKTQGPFSANLFPFGLTSNSFSNEGFL